MEKYAFIYIVEQLCTYFNFQNFTKDWWLLVYVFYTANLLFRDKQTSAKGSFWFCNNFKEVSIYKKQK